MKKATQDLPAEAKCTRCQYQAVVRMPQHHANFCSDCFLLYFQKAVRRAMRHFNLSKDTKLMVAVSGGKDSLALWDVLNEVGYQTMGLHIHLGIEEFSEASIRTVESFALSRNLPCRCYSLQELTGFDLYQLQSATRRKMCSLCGTLKRQFLNRLTIREGFQVLAVGHNLDDEAGRLLGNLVRHREHYLEKQSPCLPSPHPRMPLRIKPLYRLEASEIQSYCHFRGVQFLSEKCPLSRGATSHFFKEALDELEMKMPGTKRDFLFGYLKRHKASAETEPFKTCKLCGEPAYSDTCSVCGLLASATEKVDRR